jgi:flavin-dependent dehydrogenase
VLTGDAGHFKDPAPGRGIGDAFLQADALAPAIVDGLGGSEKELDKGMARFGRWRDKEFAEYYWFGCDMGAGGPLPAVLPEIVRGLQAQGQADLVLETVSHRRKPSRLMTPPRVLTAAGRLLRRGGADRAAMLRETGTLLARDMRRRWRNRRPAYADSAVRRDSGPTEIEHSAVA